MNFRRRETADFSMSFLDTLSVGFGAMILLLMITKDVQPVVFEKTERHLNGSIAALQAQLFKIKGDTRVLNRDLTARRDELTSLQEMIAGQRETIEKVKSSIVTVPKPTAAGVELAKYALARETLTDEMKRLLEGQKRQNVDTIGGIPVDSEYIIFVIDTSGSMFGGCWPLVQQKVAETLKVYPNVKGIQVMSDEGTYMFPQYRDQWIPDSNAQRKAIKERLRSFNPSSGSNPVPGIEKAIRVFYATNKKISIYVFGDDFTGGSVQEVLDTVERLNAKDASGSRRVRIHAVGFPTVVSYRNGGSVPPSGTKFASLMRQLTQRNGGSFVALPSVR